MLRLRYMRSRKETERAWFQKRDKAELVDPGIQLRSKIQMISTSATMHHDKGNLAQAFVSKVTGDRHLTARSFLLYSSFHLAAYASCDQP